MEHHGRGLGHQGHGPGFTVARFRENNKGRDKRHSISLVSLVGTLVICEITSVPLPSSMTAAGYFETCLLIAWC